MKKTLNIILVTFLVVLILSCGNSEKESTSNVATIPQEEMLQKEASRLRAGGSVKNVTLENNKATITYVKDFEEYKNLNPQSSLNEYDLRSYWESEQAIERALVDGSVRLMRKLEFLNHVVIILPVDGRTYTIDISKGDLTEYLNVDFEEVKSNWDDTFSNPYVYSEKGRKKFFEKFGKVE